MDFIIAFLSVMLIAVPILADGTHPKGIKLDGTVGNASKLTLPGPDYDIRAEYGQQAGTNLFHSFQQFNIHSGESATFTGPDSVRNIVSRVTGGDSSWIDGKLGSAISGADLYLLNPAGLMFGTHASPDLSGSFHVSTADYLMGENDRFYSTPHADNVLSVSAPSAFGFLDDTPAPITFRGSGSAIAEETPGIRVQEGETLSVIGGDIEITGGLLPDTGQAESSLRAPGGRINIAGVASPGEVVPAESDLDAESFAKLGDVTISDGSFATVTSQGAGNVYIRGENFVIDNSETPDSENTTGVSATSLGDTDGGAIDIKLDGDNGYN